MRSTSVLMFAGPEGMPERIKEKYPHRMYKLPADGVAGIRAVLAVALKKTGTSAELPESEAPVAKSGRPRRRGGAAKGGRAKPKA